MGNRIDIYDVTLRDGAQGPGVKFTADDQLRIVQELDQIGVAYIEGGQPASNPKAKDLFTRANALVKNAKMAAFGSTRHPKAKPEDDANLRALLDAETEVVTIFAKSSRLHAEEILRVSLDDNLRIVEESVAYLREQGRRVFLDAEHFYDGYAEDPEYALSVLERGLSAGAEVIILCDTNGGQLPWQVEDATRAVRERFPGAQVGVHAHNDSACGVANSLAAVRQGATQVQGTINGYGERTGNANLCAIIPDLQLKMGLEVFPPEKLTQLTPLSHLVAELANMTPRDHDPFVGRDAFTHKGGMHADAVKKLKKSYEHIDPILVGNTTHVSVSEMAGRSSLLQKAAEFDIELQRDTPETRRILERIKELENRGFEFEGADASLELLMRKAIGQYRSFFVHKGFRVRIEQADVSDATALSEATLKLELPSGAQMHTVAEGHGPVDALNNALRKALEPTYPELAELHLEDYKVRILDGRAGTRAQTRVLIESGDGETTWNTVGVSENIISASYWALIDSIEYKLLRVRGYEEDAA